MVYMQEFLLSSSSAGPGNAQRGRKRGKVLGLIGDEKCSEKEPQCDTTLTGNNMIKVFFHSAACAARGGRCDFQGAARSPGVEPPPLVQSASI